MIYASILRSQCLLSFNELPKLYNKKSSNHSCYKHLGRLYRKHASELPKPWEREFYYKFMTLLVKNAGKYGYARILSLSIGDFWEFDDPRLNLAALIKRYLDYEGGSYSRNFTRYKLSNRAYAGSQEFVELKYGLTKPKTYLRVLYNFYEACIPNSGNYTLGINYKEVINCIEITKLKFEKYSNKIRV